MQVATSARTGVFDHMKCFGAIYECVSVTESHCGCPMGHMPCLSMSNMPHFDVFAQPIQSTKRNHFDIAVWRPKRDVARFCPCFCFL